MSGDMVKVDFGQVTSLAQGIGQQANNIEQLLDSLKQQISNLDQIWDGSASDGYKQTKAKWFQSAEDLQQVLAKISTAVHAASESYQATESGNAKMWG
ncbi:MAG TPA: WXG100 family type VII secretion target [Pseudonocardiaceae bacterium]|jgi:WXG100 family type VII secretion target|nr:WXG100 family type VII secretion target [Pseudonocardiaceae bacterium]